MSAAVSSKFQIRGDIELDRDLTISSLSMNDDFSLDFPEISKPTEISQSAFIILLSGIDLSAPKVRETRRSRLWKY